MSPIHFSPSGSILIRHASQNIPYGYIRRELRRQVQKEVDGALYFERRIRWNGIRAVVGFYVKLIGYFLLCGFIGSFIGVFVSRFFD